MVEYDYPGKSRVKKHTKAEIDAWRANLVGDVVHFREYGGKAETACGKVNVAKTTRLIKDVTCPDCLGELTRRKSMATVLVKTISKSVYQKLIDGAETKAGRLHIKTNNTEETAKQVAKYLNVGYDIRNHGDGVYGLYTNDFKSMIFEPKTNLAENAAIHAYYDSHPKKDKMRVVKSRKHARKAQSTIGKIR